MKKNFLTVVAMTIVAFFVSTEIAKAADISFSGQIRTRWEVNEHSGAGPGATTTGFNNQPDDFIASSVRLAATANINDTTSAFIQLQSNRTWGQASAAGMDKQGGGSGNASATANDKDASVGVHQAYFTLKNFASLPVDAKVGRQEIVLDGHRLFGNTIWTMGMQSHDAIRMNHKHGNMALSFAYILRQEDGRKSDPTDGNDFDVYLAHLNYKGVLGGQFSAYYVFSNENCAGASCRDNNFHTVGGRQAGQLFGLDYRGELYYQFGSADGVAGINQKNRKVADRVAVDADRSAYMFGVRVGKTFQNVMLKPGVTLWYDYLSGTTDEDQGKGNWNSFNTLYDTGHKFYGLQDLFLGVGSGSSAGTKGLGLQDLALKFKLNPMPGWTFKLAAHAFSTAETAQSNPNVSGIEVGTTPREDDSAYLGNEVDLTLVNKYNANTNIMIGFSNFNGSRTFKEIKGNGIGGESDANWAYVQFDVKF